MKVSDAERTLERFGLGYERAGNGDTVKTQSPTAGTRVKRGTRIRLSLVAANPDRTHPSEEDIVYIDIPNVTGIPVREAKQRLKAAGLSFQVHGGDESGSVVKQDPPPGRTKVRRGETVTVHLYRGVG
jgi:beta-lactam-binding protein with PASTA domain